MRFLIALAHNGRIIGSCGVVVPSTGYLLVVYGLGEGRCYGDILVVSWLPVLGVPMQSSKWYAGLAVFLVVVVVVAVRGSLLYQSM